MLKSIGELYETGFLSASWICICLILFAIIASILILIESESEKEENKIFEYLKEAKETKKKIHRDFLLIDNLLNEEVLRLIEITENLEKCNKTLTEFCKNIETKSNIKTETINKNEQNK